MVRQRQTSRNKRSPGPFDRELGRRLRRGRHLRGMTQAALAEALGVSMQQVQKYEKGFSRLCAWRLVQAAHALYVPVADLLYGTGKEPAYPETPRNVLELIRLSHALRPTQQRLLCHLAMAMEGRNAKGASSSP